MKIFEFARTHCFLALLIFSQFQAKIFHAKVEDSSLSKLAPKLIGRYWVHDTHPHIKGEFTLRYANNFNETQIPKGLKVVAMNTTRYKIIMSNRPPFLIKKNSNLAQNEEIKTKICMHIQMDAMFEIPISFSKALKNRAPTDPKQSHKELIFNFEDSYEILHHFALSKSDDHNQEIIDQRHAEMAEHKNGKT